MQQLFLYTDNKETFRNKPAEGKGIVYTKPWVAELILDLAGYSVEADLASKVAIEPSAGDGAFLIPMVTRLIKSSIAHGHTLDKCRNSILAYELSEASAERARKAIIKALCSEGVAKQTARNFAEQWIIIGDYLLNAPDLPAADFVIGNPPYIRLEDIPNLIFDDYRKLYPTMKGRADIYVGFYEAALRQLKSAGTCAFICADRWMLNQYGGELRKFITGNFSVEAIIEMHNADAFEEEVNAYPAITVIKRKQQGPVVVAAAGNGGMTTRDADAIVEYYEHPIKRNVKATTHVSMTTVDSWFDGASPWPCGSPARLKLLRRLEAVFEPLESADTGTKVGIGVATGLDEVFITKDAKLVERERLLPLAMANDTKTGQLKWSGHYLVNPWNCSGLVELTSYPRLKSYFEQHGTRLKQRHTAQKNLKSWYKTIDKVNAALTARPKLYIPDIKDRFNPVLDTGQAYPHHNLYFIQSDTWDLEVLGGLLLSQVAQLFIEMYGVKMRGGWLRFQAQYLRKVRLPKPDQIDAAIAEKLRAAFRQRDYHSATEAAFELYGVTIQERKYAFGH